MNANLYAVFQSRFPKDRSHVCLELDNGKSLSYLDMDRESGRIAKLLLDLDIEKGDRVLVQVEKSAEAVLLYLACLRVGAIYLPLNTAYTTSELEYFVGDAEPMLIVCQPEKEQALNTIAHHFGVKDVLTLGAHGEGSLLHCLDSCTPTDYVASMHDDDLAAILYTSGTTGRSKGAMLSHKNLRANAQTLHTLWGWETGDVLIHSLPIFHVHGLFVALHCALLNGSTILFLQKFNADDIVERLPRATVLMGVPTFYTRLLEHPSLNKLLCNNMRLFISGSAPMLTETFAQFKEKTGHAILERYGMTEAGMITSNPLKGERVAGTVGYFLPEVSGRIVDEEGNELAADEKGVLEIMGPNVFQGYWRMPEKTEGEFHDGYFITGDIATMSDDGRISIVGRAKDLIISGGFNVYPKEVETLIDEIEGVGESAVIGLPHPDFGEAVTAIVTRTNESTESETILHMLQDKLAKFKQPKQVIFIDVLPRNTMGKVQKNQLREQYQHLYQ